MPLEPERLAPALRALPALNFAGANITVPHKLQAMEIVDEVDRVTDMREQAMRLRESRMKRRAIWSGVASPISASASRTAGSARFALFRFRPQCSKTGPADALTVKSSSEASCSNASTPR